MSIHQRDAVLFGARLAGGQSVTLPDAPHVHLFVALGAAELDGAGALLVGDAVRLTNAGARHLTATADGTELLVWATA